MNPHHIDANQKLSQDAKIEQKTRKLSKQRSKKRKSFSVTLKKKKVDDSLKLAKIDGAETMERVNKSFAWAFFCKKMKYTSNLVYDHNLVQEEMNDPKKLEPKLQKLSK